MPVQGLCDQRWTEMQPARICVGLPPQCWEYLGRGGSSLRHSEDDWCHCQHHDNHQLGSQITDSHKRGNKSCCLQLLWVGALSCGKGSLMHKSNQATMDFLRSSPTHNPGSHKILERTLTHMAKLWNPDKKPFEDIRFQKHTTTSH